MRELFPGFRSPTLFPIKGPQEALGFMVVDRIENHETEDFQLITQFASILFDMSDAYRRLAEEVELRRSLEALLRKERDVAQMYLDVAGVIILALDNRGKVLLINAKGSEVLGRPSEEVVGKDWLDFTAPADRVRVGAFFSDLAAGTHPQDARVEYSICASDETERLIEWRCTVTRDEQGNVTGSLSSGEDITETRKAEEERERLRARLVQAQKMEAIGTLAAGIAHDFNNLLTIINGFAELLLGGFSEGAEGYVGCKSIMQAATKGAELVDKLLAYGLKGASAARPVDLNEHVRRITGLLKLTIPKTVQIEFTPAPDPVVVVADPSMIDHIVVNLATNAGDAMPRGGRLSIEVGARVFDEEPVDAAPGPRRGPYAVLTVSDTGRGMDKAELERIFDPYFTSKQWDSTKGRGLGLTVVYGIVERLGGAIECSSAPGEGSTFTIFIPAWPVDSTDYGASTPSNRPDRVEKILWADNDELMGGLGRSILNGEGYDVVTASDGRELLEIYRREWKTISLTVFDAQTPEMGAARCIEAILDVNPDAKVVVALGDEVAGEGARLVKAGARKVLRKPYQIQETLKVVREALREEAAPRA
jgi:PAS domain S-box-containing protein